MASLESVGNGQTRRSHGRQFPGGRGWPAFDAQQGSIRLRKNTHSVYMRNPQVDLSQAGERNVLYHQGQAKAVILNPTGSLLWNFLENPATHEQLLAHLQAQFSEVPVATLDQDLKAYLKELLEQDILQCN